jgi:radical SAM superfamily enzyme YgiQ (UPF0313 family)
MKTLLVRPPYVSPFSRMNLVNVEPLELEILLGAAVNDGHNCLIYDGIVERRSLASVLKEYNPDIAAITGYITQRNLILAYAETIKEYNPSIKVIIGGVHAELNYAEFFHPTVDYIVHSGGVRPFRELLDCFSNDNSAEDIPGICFRSANNEWKSTPKIVVDPEETTIPDRSFFYQHREKFNYLHFRPCAIVKTSYSCPHRCNFCYCCLLNEGKYLCRSVDKVVAEIAGIDCENIWIVDDTFYLEHQRIKDFVRLLQENGIKKNFILYYRADFIAENEEMIALLKSVGLKMVLVGLEAFDDETLQDFEKNTTSRINEKCLSILRKYDIDCTALFVLDIDAKKEDFDNLSRYVQKHRLRFSTASILTPLPGTQQYDKYRDRITVHNPKHWDFLHLVAPPGHMGRWIFYLYFYRFYLQVLVMNLPWMMKSCLQGLFRRKA